MNGNIVLLLKKLNLALEQCGREHMKRLDISPSQGLALSYLFSREGYVTYSTQLHKQFGISKPAISSTLKGLKKKGYLEMVVNEEDDRKKQIVLTPKAYAIKKQIDLGLSQQQTRLCQGISQQRLKLLEKDLTTMLCNMNRETTRRDES